MDFADILNQWEKQGGSNSGLSGGSRPDGGFQAKDADDKNRRIGEQEKRRRLRNKRPDAELDIHGKTRDEAWLVLETFFNDARSKEFEKVLIIHGKGNHSEGESVLKRVVMDFIEHCPFAGESGRGKASAGGEGATWVLLKEAEQ
jgi:DNA-nicking Smr family endonuclease